MRAVFTAWLCFCLVACSTLRPIGQPTPTSIRTQLKIGDEVLVRTTSNQEYALNITALGEKSLRGSDEGYATREVRYEDISSIHVKQISTGKTIGLVAVILYVVAGAVVAYSMSRWLSNLGG